MKKILSAVLLTMLLSGCSLLPTNSQTTEKAPASTEFATPLSANEGSVAGSTVKYSLAYDKDKWITETPKTGSPAEYSFTHVDGDVYSMIIAERLTFSLDALKELALNNAKSIAPDAKIILEETRKVNGVDVLAMKIEGTTSGIPFIYYGYYYTGKMTSLQVVTYTSQELFPQYEEELTKFLSGLKIDESTIMTAEETLTATEKAPLTAGLVEGSQMPYSIKYNPEKWTVKNSASEEVSEYFFSHVDGDVYGMVIPERIQADAAGIKKVALANAKAAAPDAKITAEETRKVNGKDLLVLQLTGTVQGIKFQYYGYYYAGKSGVIQFISYTSPELFKQYEKDITDLLNGLAVTE